MKIQISGFMWNPTPADIMVPFLDHLSEKNEQVSQAYQKLWIPNATQDDLENYNRFAIVLPSADKKVWGGFLLTVKNARKFVSSMKKEKGFHIKTKDLEGDAERFAEINFFIFNTETKAGLYQHYHNSARPSAFNRFFSDEFQTYGVSRGYEKPKLGADVYKSKADFEEAVKKLKSVHHVEYELTTLDIREGDAVPASGLIHRRTQKVFFPPLVREGEEVKNELATFISDNIPIIKRFKVKGSVGTEADVVYSLLQGATALHESSFNDFSVELDVDDVSALKLEDCQNIQYLIDVSKVASIKTFFYAPRA